MQFRMSGSVAKIIAMIVAVVTLSVLPACGTRPFRLKNILKSNIDLVADAHLQEMNNLLRTLMIKLYKRNPRELQKISNKSIKSRLTQIFGQPGELKFEELNYKQRIEAMLLSFDERYQGDRVFPLMVGLVGMIRKSYNDQSEFFLLDTLDQQKLYNSARNIEILVWRLSNKQDQQGRLFFLTNEAEGQISNLSFERIFGKMIAIQDMMARIIADKTNRTINYVVHKLATATFLPVGF